MTKKKETSGVEAMTPETPSLETLRAHLRDALLAGNDTTSIRSDLERVEREQREAAEAKARAAAQVKADAAEAVRREACARAEASAGRLQSMINNFEA